MAALREHPRSERSDVDGMSRSCCSAALDDRETVSSEQPFANHEQFVRIRIERGAVEPRDRYTFFAARMNFCLEVSGSGVEESREASKPLMLGCSS